MKSSWKRVFVWVSVLLLFVLLGKFLGLESYARPSVLRELLLGAGSWGYVLFVGLFVAGCVLGVPGMLFVAASVYTFGKFEGGILAISGGVVAVTIQFALARWVGGQVSSERKPGILSRLLRGLDSRPVLTVIVLRLAAILSPPVNYALAWSNIRFRDYVVGSTVGLTVVLSLIISFFSFLLPIH